MPMQSTPCAARATVSTAITLLAKDILASQSPFREFRQPIGTRTWRSVHEERNLSSPKAGFRSTEPHLTRATVRRDNQFGNCTKVEMNGSKMLQASDRVCDIATCLSISFRKRQEDVQPRAARCRGADTFFT